MDTSLREESVLGDLCSFFSGVATAAYMNVVRYAARVRPEATLLSASPLSSLLATLLGLVMAGGRVGSHCAPKSAVGGLISLFVTGAILMPLVVMCNSVGGKDILSAEAGLLMLLQVVLAPFFVWIALKELPGTFTIIGGALLLVVLVAHELANVAAEKKLKRKSSDLSSASANVIADQSVPDVTASIPVDVIGHELSQQSDADDVIGHELSQQSGADDQTEGLRDARF